MAISKYKDIAARLIPHAKEICKKILSNGKNVGNQWICGDSQNNPGQSLHVNLTTGHWYDFQTEKGGDLLQLYQDANGCSKKESLEWGKTFLGITDNSMPSSFTPPPTPVSDTTKDKAALYAAAASKAECILREDCHDVDANHPYIVRKQISSEAITTSGVQQHWDGRLVVPVRDAETGQLWSIQYIPAASGEKKKSLPGGRMKGGCLRLPGEQLPDVTVLCEGWATGCAIWQSLGCHVVCAFSAGFLDFVARALVKQSTPSMRFVVAADNDCESDHNTGVEKGKQAARVLGAALAICPAIDGHKADYNDIYCLQGPKAVAASITTVLTSWTSFERTKVEYDVARLPQIADDVQRLIVGHVYQRNGRLVRVVHLAEKLTHGAVRLPQGTAVIDVLDGDSLTSVLSDHIDFQKFNLKNNLWRSCVPPKELVSKLLVQKKWSLPVLSGITSCPLIRYDGSLLTAEGYDKQTGLLADYQGVQFPSIPETPTYDDARAALYVLCDAIGEFPFWGENELEREASRNVALAAILTTVLRSSVAQAPMFLFSAPTPGTGKSTLADLVSIIATGKPSAAISYSFLDEENRKSIFAVLLEGAQVVLLDNITGIFNSPVMNIVLSQEQYRARILGVSGTASVSTSAVWLGTGNNLAVSQDMVRRCLVATLNAGIERPEGRHFARDIYSWANENRTRLVCAALTILRAFYVAGRPGLDTLKPFANYEQWSAWVRGSLQWLSGISNYGDSWGDPLLTLQKASEDDPAREQLQDILAAWFKIFGSYAVKLKTVIDKAQEEDGEDLLTALMAVDEKLNSKKIAQFLRRKRDVPCSGFVLQRGERMGNANNWRVLKI